MLYIGRFKRLRECDKCPHSTGTWLCKTYTKQKHLIWWPEQNIVKNGVQVTERQKSLFGKAFICSRNNQFKTKEQLSKANNIIVVRLHNGKTFIIPSKLGERPPNIFNELVGWVDPMEEVRTFGKF